MIVGSSGETVGRVTLPDPDEYTPSPRLYDFIILSEGQFFGDEKNVEIGEYPLFNVMLISWSNARARGG